ncbi:MAG: NifU family protein [Janthinobacterium lividum]
MFIQIEATPNPNALKFFPAQEVSPDQPIHFGSKEDAKGKSSLALKLFDIDNIKTVFFGSDFITITKADSTDWNILRPEVLMTIMDHVVSGFPVFDDNLKDRTINYEDRSDIEKQIIELIETRVRPSVAMDGGDIVYRGFEDGVVKLELYGSCAGCPSSSITLKNGIESMLKLYIPEVESVEAVSSEES